MGSLRVPEAALGLSDPQPHPKTLIGVIVVLIVSIALFLLARTVLRPYASQTHSFARTKRTRTRADRKLYAPPPGYFLNKDNLYIYHQTWEPRNGRTVQGVVVLVHGVGEHCGRYEVLASRLADELGVAVVSLDHQGHGKSEGDRLFVVSFDDYLEDVYALSNMALKKYGNLPQYMLGHSMGGLIGIRVLEKFPGRFRNAVISAPALSVNATSFERSLAPLMSQYLPQFPMNQVDPNLLSHDPCVVDLYVNDPLVTTTGVTARLGSEILDTIDQAIAFAYELTLPYLLIRGADDRIALRPGIVQFNDSTKSKDKTFTEFPELYHEIFNEPDSPAIPLVISWFKARMNIA